MSSSTTTRRTVVEGDGGTHITTEVTEIRWNVQNSTEFLSWQTFSWKPALQ